MKNKAFLFDMDGVIIDSEPIHAATKLQALRHFGLQVPEEELRLDRFVGRSGKSTFTELLAEYPELGVDWETIAAKKHEIYRKILREDDSIKPIPGVVNLLQRLKEKGYHIALASSSVMPNIEIILNKFQIKDYFESITSGQEVPNAKPDPTIFLLAASRVGIAPENCTVVEDSTAGVKAAKAAGMKCIAYDNPNSVNQDLSPADMIINDYDEIILE